MAQLTPFMALKEELGDRLMLLEKLHHTVELAVTLEQVLKLPKQAVSFGARFVVSYDLLLETEEHYYWRGVFLLYKVPTGDGKNLENESG